MSDDEKRTDTARYSPSMETGAHHAGVEVKGARLIEKMTTKEECSA